MRFAWGGCGSRRQQAHEQEPVVCGGFWGGGPAVPADSAVGAGVTPVCPMRRGQAGCGTFCLGRARGQTVTGSRAGACRLRRVGRRCLAPVGQGALRGCVFDAVCPCGAKALLSGAPDFGVYRGGKLFAGRFALERWSGGAPGGRKHAVLRSMGPPCPRSHPAGGTAGSARTRSRVQTLENPFLGERPRFSPLPRPPKRRRRQAPARGLAVVCAHDRPKRNEAQRVRPLLVGRMRVESEPTA